MTTVALPPTPLLTPLLSGRGYRLGRRRQRLSIVRQLRMFSVRWRLGRGAAA